MSYVIVNYPKILNQTKFKPFIMKNQKKIFKHLKIDSKGNDEIGISKGEDRLNIVNNLINQ